MNHLRRIMMKKTILKTLLIVTLAFICSLSCDADWSDSKASDTSNTATVNVPDPFQEEINWTNDPTQLGGGGSFIVPDGKLLVIEQLSAQVGVAQGQPMAYTVHTIANGNYASHRFQLNESPITGGDYANYWLFDRQVRIYADEGTTVSVDVQNNLGGESGCWSTVSGYLVDLGEE